MYYQESVLTLIISLTFLNNVVHIKLLACCLRECLQSALFDLEDVTI